MANEWIMVEDHLPKKPGKYLITKHDYFGGWVTDAWLWADGWNRTPGDDGRYEIKDAVRAWKPMPEPWSPERREG